MASLFVGPGEQYLTLAAAVAAAKDGDVIEVQAGTYTDDFATVTTKITIQGVGGMVSLVSNESTLASSGSIDPGRAILITTTDVTLDHVEISGAADGPANNNGAGVLAIGGNLSINASYFHNNQEGILTGPDVAPVGTVYIVNSELAYNGIEDGYTHNLYVSSAASLYVADSYFHDSELGHEIKTGAAASTIVNNVIADGPTADASYSVDFFNGGTNVLADNTIEKGPNSPQDTFIHLGGAAGTTSLTIDQNTFLYDRTDGYAKMVLNQTTGGVVPTISNNAIYSPDSFSYSNGPTTLSNNTMLSAEPSYSTADPFDGVPEIDFAGPPSHFVATGTSESISLFSGFTFTVPYDGPVDVTLSNWNSAIGSVSYIGSDAAITVQESGMAALAITGMASDIVSDLKAGLFTYTTTALPGSDGVQVSVSSPAVFLDLATGGAGALENSFGVGLADVPCYCRGTHILTEAGEIAVERLQVGWNVVTAAGAAVPIRWIGHRAVDIVTHPKPDAVLPIRVRAHAFAPGKPACDLMLSPDHAVFVDCKLIPIKHLLNGDSVAQITVHRVEYWHVELEHHDILLADGLPCESYLDTGNRTAFANGQGVVSLWPNFTRGSWGGACAPLLQEGPQLVAIKERLFRRSGIAEGGPASCLWVQADQQALQPERVAAGVWHCRIPPSARSLHLRSSSWVPAQCLAPALDQRRLGIRVFAVAFDGHLLDLGDPAFFSGFHAKELTAEGPCRWTDGSARLVLSPGTSLVSLHVETQMDHGGRLSNAA